MPTDSERPGFVERLFSRAREAHRRAAQLVGEAAVMTRTSAAMRAEVAARCAWCGRYRLGDNWLGVDDLPGFAGGLPEASHTICPDCVERLRDEGRSI